MASVIMIHRRKDGVDEQLLYGKPDGVPLEEVNDPAVLWSAAPKIYLTGLTSLHSQKRLAVRLAKIDPDAVYSFERLAAEDVLGRLGLTATARHQGRVKPKYGHGG